MTDHNEVSENPDLGTANLLTTSHAGDSADIEAVAPQPPGLKGKKGKDSQRPKKPVPGRGVAAAGRGLSNPKAAELVSQGQGFINTVKENFGFIRSPDMKEQLFFHYSEVVKPEDFKGSMLAYFKEQLATGDEVEFAIGPGRGNKAVGQKVKKLPMHTVKADLLSEEHYTGAVTTELNNGQWRSEGPSTGLITYQEKRPDGQQSEAQVAFFAADVHNLRRTLKKGTAVDFRICTDNQTQSKRAVHVELKSVRKGQESVKSNNAETSDSQPPGPVLLHGFIKSLKPNGTGSIRCIEERRRYAFKMSDVPAQHQQDLKVGSEVVFNLSSDDGRNQAVISLAILPPNSLPSSQTATSPQAGRVVRPCLDAAHGLIMKGLESQLRFRAGPMEGSSGDASTLKVDDEVEFLLHDDFKIDQQSAIHIKLLVKAEEKRELGQIRTLKSNFGFIACCQRSGQVFFHFSSLEGCEAKQLQKNDDVEFSIVRDPEHGRVAVRVRKVPPGTAVFETVSTEEYEGVIQTPMYHISPLVLSSGVLSYRINGAWARLLFSENDFKETVHTGDWVTFRIADNLKAAKQAENLGLTVSRLIGQRATDGRLLRVQGSVKSSNGTSGFLKYAGKDNVEKRVPFHINEVAEKLHLRVGDEVAFSIADSPRTKQPAAKNVIRTQEAKEVAEETSAVPRVTPAPAERRTTPVIKQSLNLISPLALRPTPAMPDGTRGFTFGRGAALQQPGPKSSGAGTAQGAPGKLASDGLSGTGNSGSGLGRPASLLQLEGKSTPIPRPLHASVANDLNRSASSHALNPAAADFMPRSASGKVSVPEPIARPVIS